MIKENVLNLIDNEKNFYEDLITHNKLTDDEKRDYQSRIKELNKLHKIICFTKGFDHPVFELLSDNYLKYNTQFQFIDGTNTHVENNQMCSINDNYLTVHEMSDDKTIIPPVNQIINLSNVKMVQVEYTPEITDIGD